MPDTMKAAFIKQAGPAESIIFGELPKPVIQDNQVLVRVKTVAVEHVDTYFRSGQYSTEGHFPYILGRNLCGVVEKVGKQVKSFKPGQRVWGNNLGVQGRQGTFSEYAAIDEEYLYHLPDGVDEKEAVAILSSATTALMGLIRIGKLKANETIFVGGGAGNVGSAIIQFSAARGANVIASAGSQEKVDWCKKIGASQVINYKTQNVEHEVKKIAPNGVNLFWDTSRQPNLEMAVDLLSKQGRIVLMAGYNAHPTIPVGPFYNKECSMYGFTILNASQDELKSYSDIINKALSDKILQPRIAQVLTLADTAKAHKIQETDPKLWGKIVLTV